MSGSFIFICRPCSLAAALAVLRMSEKFKRIIFLISSSVAVAGNSVSMCSIEGVIPWHRSSLKDRLLNFEAASIWLSQVMHSDLFVPSKVLMFFIICFVPSPLLFAMTCDIICVNASVILAAWAGDMLFAGDLCTVVLDLGWFGLYWFWNQCLLFIVPIVVVGL